MPTSVLGVVGLLSNLVNVCPCKDNKTCTAGPRTTPTSWVGKEVTLAFLVDIPDYITLVNSLKKIGEQGDISQDPGLGPLF